MTQVLHAPVMRHFLDFEKPIAELEGKIEELRRMAGGDSINVADEIARLTDKADRQLRATYAKLTAWQKTQVARHPQRPKASDYVRALITDFTPLAGDRAFGDDAAVIGGLGRFEGRAVVVLGTEKGSDTESRVAHNFGMARPEGYRKARRLFELAGRFGLPVLSFVAPEASPTTSLLLLPLLPTAASCRAPTRPCRALPPEVLQ